MNLLFTAMDLKVEQHEVDTVLYVTGDGPDGHRTQIEVYRCQDAEVVTNFHNVLAAAYDLLP